jgi:hypothetical protein
MREEPRPSARVRLEIEFLDDIDAPAPAPSPHDEPPGLTVLVVAPDSDVRRYVAECLRGRMNVRIAEASNARMATAIASAAAPDLLIIDQRDRLEGLSHVRTIAIVDDVPYGTTAIPRLRLLARPFSAEHLMEEVDQLLRES